MRALVLLVPLAAAVTAPRLARADGAFPDSQSLIAPPGRPHEILLCTNFGVITSEDDGRTWTWSCEQDATPGASLYQLGPEPRHRLFTLALANGTMAYTDDGACSWQLAGGMLANNLVIDEFPDPTNPARVLAAAVPTGTVSPIDQIFESSDSGTTFTRSIYTASSGDNITGLEIARSAPSTIYVTMTSGSSFNRKVVRSTDGGAHWSSTDLTSVLGTGGIRLVAVDPQNAMRIYLRIAGSAGTGDRLAVSDDGGMTVTTPLTLAGGVMNAFVRASTGTLYAAGVQGTTPVLYRSKDNAVSFQQIPSPDGGGQPSFRGLAERGGVLFGAADNTADGFAVGTSTDEGVTWRPLMRYEQIVAIDACVKTLCQDSCLMQVNSDIWSEAVCSADAPPTQPVDGGAGGAATGAAGAGGAGGGGGRAAGGADGGGGTVKPGSSGCHCSTSGTPSPASLLATGAALVLWSRRRRARR